MEQQPKIPTLKDAQKPQVKIKGMGAGLTLFDRLKQFKKKDLAFILAGLGTLFMAPLAEHFMMAPEGGDSNLQQGWGKGGGAGSGGLFGSGSSPYENGNNSIAQGGAIGGAGDIITPLNVRDPSALVMGPGAAQQPNAGAVTPPTAPTAPARSETDYKDALAGAASRAASAAVKKAPLPVPKVALGGSGLRGFSAASGGSSSGSGSLGPIGGGNLGQAGTGGGGLNLVRSNPNYRGAAGARGPGNPTGLDGTKKAGANQGDAFSRTGSALSNLNAAASETIPTGGSGFNGNGQGGAGANDKPGSGSGPGGSKSVGESLAFIEAKERMMENLKLEFEKRKLKDNELLMYGIRNDVLKASAGKIGEALTTKFMCKVMNTGCPGADSDYICSGIPTKFSDIPMCDEGGGKDQTKASTTACYWKQIDGTLNSQKDGKGGVSCIPGKGSGAAKGDLKTGTAASSGPSGMYGGGLSAGSAVVGAGLDGGCQWLNNQTSAADVSAKEGGVAAKAAFINSKEKPHYAAMTVQGKQLVTARSLLNGEGSASACGAVPGAAGTKTAVALQGEALGILQKEVPQMQLLVPQTKEASAEAVTARQGSLAEAARLSGIARSQIEKAQGIANAAGPFAAFPEHVTDAATSATKNLTDAKGKLIEQAGSLLTAQAALEKVLGKAQDIAGAKGSILEVTAQNSEFDKMKTFIEGKKDEWAKTDKDWSGAKIDAPADPTADGVTAFAQLKPKIDTAQTAIKAVCDQVKCPAAAAKTDAATTDAAVAKTDAAKPDAAATDAAAKPPSYATVSPLLKPATDGVAGMRQTQGDVIRDYEKDVTAALGNKFEAPAAVVPAAKK